MNLKATGIVLIITAALVVIYFYYSAIQSKRSETGSEELIKALEDIDKIATAKTKRVEATSTDTTATTTTSTITTMASSTAINATDQKSLELETQIQEFYNAIAQRERKVYSQNREDGVIEAIFDLLSITKLKKYFVEIGTQSGVECNTRYLREVKNWTGIMFDGGHADPQINLNKEMIHANTVVEMFQKYNIPSEIDFLSEDTDYADYWIVRAILTQYRPKVLAHEINQQTGEKCVTVPRSDELIFWDGANFHGGSVCAFHCLAKQNQYSMVYCESAGVNCFWIRNDIIEKYLKFKPEIVQKVLNPVFLYKRPGFVYQETGKVWHQVKC